MVDPNLNQNFNRALKFLPKINADRNEEKNLFPSRTNFHYKRTYSKFLTNKERKESFFHSNHVSLNITNNQKRLVPKDDEKFSSPSYVTNDDNEDRRVYGHLIDMKKCTPPSEKRHRTRTKPKKKPLKSVENKNTKKLEDLDDDELKNIYYQSPVRSKLNHVIDLNFVSNNSRLSEHYLRHSNLEGRECLSDMNLNEMWPHSTMVKTTNNNWINTFKAKSIANEINRNYCDSTDPSRLEYVSNLPNSKTPNSFDSNSRIDNKRYASFLPDLKISYCQRQIL